MNPSPEQRVSVALCTYNGERFLREQLQSIVNQSRPIFELIVCDDGSTDGTPEILREFSHGAPFLVQLHFNPANLGVTQNFAKAISLCIGDVIFLSDQDDRWDETKVERMLAGLGDGVGLAFHDAAIMDAHGNTTGTRLWDSIWFTPVEQFEVREGRAVAVLLKHAVAAGSTLAFRASFRDLILPIPDFKNAHDIWLTLMIASVVRIAPLEAALMDYRLHESNQVGMRKFSLRGQIEMARWQIRTGQFRFMADLCQAAIQRLQESKTHTPHAGVLPLLREKAAHFNQRDALPGSFFKRVPLVWRELVRKNYARFSYGWKSVLQDLFLR